MNLTFFHPHGAYVHTCTDFRTGMANAKTYLIAQGVTHIEKAWVEMDAELAGVKITVNPEALEGINHELRCRAGSNRMMGEK